jgi:heterodisulfide reductase subunit D
MDVEFDVEHTTKFISENIDKLQFQQEIRGRVALHSHTGSKQQDRDAEYAEKILRALPGVEIVRIKALAELGRHCSNNTIEKLTEKKFVELTRGIVNEARQNGVDILATIYHGCQREICGEESNFPIKVENYVTLLARAMGIEIADKFKKWKLMKDPEKIIEDAKDCIAANDLNLEKVRATISRNF